VLIKKAVILAGLALVKHGKNRTRFERAKNIDQERTGIERTSRKNNKTALFPIQLAEATMNPAGLRTRKSHFDPPATSTNNELFLRRNDFSSHIKDLFWFSLHNLAIYNFLVYRKCTHNFLL
jgi:hypothetical protein